MKKNNNPKSPSIFTSLNIFNKRLILGGFLIFFFSCGEFDPTIGRTDNISKSQEEPDLFLTTFETTSFEKTKKNWHIQSRTARVFEAQKKTFMKNVTFITFDIKGKQSTFITANEAELHNETYDITLKKNVNIVNNQGTETTGDLFYWNNKKRTFTSPDRVKVAKKDGSVISGKGFKSNQALGDIEFESDVSGQLNSSEEDDFFEGF